MRHNSRYIYLKNYMLIEQIKCHNVCWTIILTK